MDRFLDMLDGMNNDLQRGFQLPQDCIGKFVHNIFGVKSII